MTILYYKYVILSMFLLSGFRYIHMKKQVLYHSGNIVYDASGCKLEEYL